MAENVEEKTTSPSAKASRGIAEDQVTTWVDLNLDVAGHEMVSRAAKHRGVKISAMLGKLLKAALTDAAWASIKADAAKYVPPTRSIGKAMEDMDEAELTAHIEKLQARANKLLARANVLKGGRP